MRENTMAMKNTGLIHNQPGTIIALQFPRMAESEDFLAPRPARIPRRAGPPLAKGMFASENRGRIDNI